MSPSNGFIFFIQAAHYVGALPFAWEFLGDFFSHNNGEKRGLGRLRVSSGGKKLLIDIISFSSNNRKKLSEIVTHTGENLVDYHHRLLEIAGYEVDRRDMTAWFNSNGKPVDYYYPYLLHFVAHGVLFENFTLEGDGESHHEAAFTRAVVLPAIAKIEEKFGLKPLIIRLYPKQQSPEEDFYWWCYPPQVNDFIVDSAQRHKLPFSYWQPKDRN